MQAVTRSPNSPSRNLTIELIREGIIKEYNYYEKEIKRDKNKTSHSIHDLEFKCRIGHTVFATSTLTSALALLAYTGYLPATLNAATAGLFLTISASPLLFSAIMLIGLGSLLAIVHCKKDISKLREDYNLRSLKKYFVQLYGLLNSIKKVKTTNSSLFEKIEKKLSDYKEEEKNKKFSPRTSTGINPGQKLDYIYEYMKEIELLILGQNKDSIVKNLETDIRFSIYSPNENEEIFTKINIDKLYKLIRYKELNNILEESAKITEEEDKSCSLTLSFI